MPFFASHPEASPLIVVRTVDREKTIGVYVVTEEKEEKRTFLARRIAVKGSSTVLRPEVQPDVFHAVVEAEDVVGIGVATSLTRRVRYQQLGWFDPALVPFE